MSAIGRVTRAATEAQRTDRGENRIPAAWRARVVYIREAAADCGHRPGVYITVPNFTRGEIHGPVQVVGDTPVEGDLVVAVAVEGRKNDWIVITGGGLAELEKRLGEVEGRVTETESGLTVVQSGLATVEGEVATARNEAQAAQTRADAAHTEISSLEERTVRVRYLDTESLNDITDPGIYIQESNNRATLARNYPPGATNAGELRVWALTSGWVMQVYIDLYGSKATRYYNGNSSVQQWQDWEPANLAIEVDTSAGTRVSIGGRVVNYDSGWRDVSDYLGGHSTATVAGSVQVRRTLNEVQYRVDITSVSGGSGWFRLVRTLPSGFNHDGLPNQKAMIGIGYEVHALTGSTAGVNWNGMVDTSTDGIWSDSHPTSGFSGRFTMTTSDPIPTTLPGTPA